MLEKAKANGAKIIAVNPLPEAGLIRFKDPQKVHGVVGHGIPIADEFVQIRLGGDMALFAGLGRLLLSLSQPLRRLCPWPTLQRTNTRDASQHCRLVKAIDAWTLVQPVPSKGHIVPPSVAIKAIRRCLNAAIGLVIAGGEYTHDNSKRPRAPF